MFKVPTNQNVLAGDNTPAFDFQTNKILPEFIEGYAYLNQHHPDLACTKVFNEYLALLKTTDYKHTEAVSLFIEQHRLPQ